MATTPMIFPPAVLVQDESITIVDDMTEVFRPTLARGQTQRQSYGGPRLKLTRKVFVRQKELGLMLSFLQAMRGKNAAFYAAVNYKSRGAFSNAELLTNNAFANGTTGWTLYDAAIASGTVTENRYRVKRLKNGAYSGVYQTPTVTAGKPYSGRGFILPGKGASVALYTLQASDTVANTYLATANISGGYFSGAIVPQTTSFRLLAFDSAGAGPMTDDFFDVPWMSASNCMLVDCRNNLLLWSDDCTQAGSWTTAACSISGNAFAGPDGSTSADALIDTVTNTTHAISQNVTVPAAVADYTSSIVVEASAKSWCFLRLGSASGTSGLYANLATGTLGTVSNGAGWANARATITPRKTANSYRITLTGTKNNADTTLTYSAGPAAADATPAYAGAGTAAITLWRTGLSQSSVPSDHGSTASTINTGEVIVGNVLRLKGLPASQTGLLLEGDIVESHGEILMATASLDSDAAGIGYLQFGPSLVYSPQDSDPVIVCGPMGKFIQASDPQVVNTFGQYGEISFDMEQVY